MNDMFGVSMVALGMIGMQGFFKLDGCFWAKTQICQTFRNVFLS